jgi:hypothetical protein
MKVTNRVGSRILIKAQSLIIHIIKKKLYLFKIITDFRLQTNSSAVKKT